jgi:hypothetical protein
MSEDQDWQTRLFEHDCLDILRWLPSECVDLIITSPPYADQRKDTYGGVHPDKYVEWFLPIAAELKRVLKQEGSFILNIKERVVQLAQERLDAIAPQFPVSLFNEEYHKEAMPEHPGLFKDEALSISGTLFQQSDSKGDAEKEKSGCAAQLQAKLWVVARIAGTARNGLRITPGARIFFATVWTLVEVANRASRAAQTLSPRALLVKQMA